MVKKTVIIECKSCDGTGVFVGVWLKDGEGVNCHDCDGLGFKKLTYEEVNPDIYPKERSGVDRVNYYTLKEGKRVEHWISYEEWKKLLNG